MQERRNLPAELKEELTGSEPALSRAHPCDKGSQALTFCLACGQAGSTSAHLPSTISSPPKEQAGTEVKATMKEQK